MTNQLFAPQLNVVQDNVTAMQSDENNYKENNRQFLS